MAAIDIAGSIVVGWAASTTPYAPPPPLLPSAAVVDGAVIGGLPFTFTWTSPLCACLGAACVYKTRVRDAGGRVLTTGVAGSATSYSTLLLDLGSVGPCGCGCAKPLKAPRAVGRVLVCVWVGDWGGGGARPNPERAHRLVS